MSPKQKSDGLTVDQGDYVVPNITIKELLDVIPWALGSYNILLRPDLV